MAFPVFFLIVLAIIEFGFYMAASSSTSSSTRSGARLGSAEIGPAAVKATVADKIRDKVASDLRSLNSNDAPVRLWVYKAFRDGSPCADVACATGTGFSSCPASVCFSYTGWNASTKTFTSRAGSWTTTDACPPTLDTVGVHVRVFHDYLSGVLGNSVTVDERTVLRFEPLPTAQCAGP
jgi:Flp pilus assembly protein TadG